MAENNASRLGEDNQRARHCIQTSETECDLTAELTDLKSKYGADVLSEALKDISSDLIEFPRTASALFCPYQDTLIGSPKFNFKVRKEERKIILNIEDIPTAVFNAQKQQLTIQDIFQNDLQYKVTYNKAKSSGKKVKISTSRLIELTDLDREESYCFSVQVYIPSRSIDKQHGESSQLQCSAAGDPTIFTVYSSKVIAGGILAILVIIAAIIAAIVICSKRRQKTKTRGKEGVPLKGV
ncbi:Tissue factor [Bagarius yarrelli]|uniref:Tissue factor n=1 Tax=Bagarius yarrelli TaxID=175774 RepID=A0A556TQ96_BAGYA|nr:Tissue factor [Bagarius yarrelli]